MAEHEGLPTRQRNWSLAVIWVALAMAVLDTSIANVALPTLSSELRATASESIWVINAYQLASVAVLLPLAACSEQLGYRRVYLTGMVVFTLASVICVLAPNLLVLAVGRGLQGIGAAGVMGMNAGLLRRILPARMLGRVLGANAAIIGAMTAIAPSLASTIVAVSSWRWLFAVNAPFCLFALGVGFFVLPTNDLAVRRFDWLSAALSALLFGGLVVGSDLVGRDADAVLGACLLIVAAGCAVFLVRRGWNAAAPLFPIDLLRIPLFGLSVATSAASFCAGLIAGVSLPFLFQQGMGRSLIEVGVLMTPWPVGTVLASGVAGYLADKIPSAVLSSAGLLAMAAGLFLLAAMPGDVDNLGIIWRTALCGAGFGFFQSPNNRTMVLATPRARGGATGGAMATARTTGQSLGAVLVALLFRMLPIVQAGRWALAAAGVLGLAAALISGLRLGHTLPTDTAHGPDDVEALTDPG